MKIFLAIDGPRSSDEATEAVIAQAKPRKVEVRVIHVIDLMSDPFPEMIEYCAETNEAQAPRSESAELLVRATAKQPLAKGFKARTAVEWGPI